MLSEGVEWSPCSHIMFIAVMSYILLLEQNCSLVRTLNDILLICSEESSQYVDKSLVFVCRQVFGFCKVFGFCM